MIPPHVTSPTVTWGLPSLDSVCIPSSWLGFAKYWLAEGEANALFFPHLIPLSSHISHHKKLFDILQEDVTEEAFYDKPSCVNPESSACSATVSQPACSHLRENTLASVLHAVEQGAHMVEVDVQVGG